jgi:hypothetical protein
VKVVIGAYDTLIDDAVNVFLIAFLKLKAHFQ